MRTFWGRNTVYYPDLGRAVLLWLVAASLCFWAGCATVAPKIVTVP